MLKYASSVPFQQVLFTGFSYGGLSELPESEYFSCSMGSTIAGEIGVFGHRPSVLMDMLAGKRVEVGTKLGAYMRTFSGDCSPSDLETALQVCFTGFLNVKLLSIIAVLYYFSAVVLLQFIHMHLFYYLWL